MLSEIENNIINGFVTVTGIPYEMLSNKLLQNKEEGTYPYWAFNTKPVEGNEVELSPVETIICRRVGPMRTKAARDNNLKNMRQVNQEKEEFIEINGLAGELCYAKKFNLYPKDQLIVESRKSKDDCGDFIHNNCIVDVKTTEYSTGRLTCASWKNKDKVKVFCLFTGDYRKSWVYSFKGWMLSSDLCVAERFGVLPGRKRSQYIAEQKDLVREFPIIKDENV